MVRKRFDESFEKLRDQSNRLANTERTTDNFDEIVDERVKLDRLRDEVTDARKDVVSRYEPPAPDVVTAVPGSGDRFGKIAAVVAGALLIVAVLVGVWAFNTFRAGFPLQLDQTVESVETRADDVGCFWEVQATLTNESERTITITHLTTVLQRSRTRARDMVLPTIGPGETAVASGTWKLVNLESCPEPNDISHTNMTIGFSHPPPADSPNTQEANRTVSRSF